MGPTLRLRSPSYAVKRKGRASACVLSWVGCKIGTRIVLNPLVCGSCGGGCFSSRASLEAVESPDVRLGDRIDHKNTRDPEGSAKFEVRSAKFELRITTTKDTKQTRGLLTLFTDNR